MVGQQLPQTNEKCYSVLQYPMCPFLPPFYGSKHSLSWKKSKHYRCTGGCVLIQKKLPKKTDGMFKHMHEVLNKINL